MSKQDKILNTIFLYLFFRLLQGSALPSVQKLPKTIFYVLSSNLATFSFVPFVVNFTSHGENIGCTLFKNAQNTIVLRKRFQVSLRIGSVKRLSVEDDMLMRIEHCGIETMQAIASLHWFECKNVDSVDNVSSNCRKFVINSNVKKW